jgi:hypothetical protein
VISIHGRDYRLFQVLKEMVVEGRELASIQLIQLQQQLHYLIAHFGSGSLSLGRVDDIPFAFSTLLHSPSPHKRKPQMHSSLVVRLWHQLAAGKVPSEPIPLEFFLRDGG